MDDLEYWNELEKRFNGPIPKYLKTPAKKPDTAPPTPDDGKIRYWRRQVRLTIIALRHWQKRHAENPGKMTKIQIRNLKKDVRFYWQQYRQSSIDA